MAVVEIIARTSLRKHILPAQDTNDSLVKGKDADSEDLYIKKTLQEGVFVMGNVERKDP